MEEDANYLAYRRQVRGDRIVERILIRRSEFQDRYAQRHLYEGFNRRVLTIESGRVVIERITGSPRREPISVYEATELSLHLNAYYLNVCGTLDNLAWALQHEFKVLGQVRETSGKRMQCTLFGKDSAQVTRFLV